MTVRPKLTTVAAAALLALAVAPLLRAEGDLSCGTGGPAAGWQCDITKTRSVHFCQHRQGQVCNPSNPWWNNYWMRKDMHRITCTKPGYAPVSCAYCTLNQEGCCWQAGEEEPPCVAPPEGPGE